MAAPPSFPPSFLPPPAATTTPGLFPLAPLFLLFHVAFSYKQVRLTMRLGTLAPPQRRRFSKCVDRGTPPVPLHLVIPKKRW
jgi:hypothetical protein